MSNKYINNKLQKDQYHANHVFMVNEVIKGTVGSYVLGEDTRIDSKMDNPFYNQDKIFCESGFIPLSLDYEKLFSGDVITNCNIINKYYGVFIFYDNDKVELNSVYNALPKKWLTFYKIKTIVIRFIPVNSTILSYLR